MHTWTWCWCSDWVLLWNGLCLEAMKREEIPRDDEEGRGGRALGTWRLNEQLIFWFSEFGFPYPFFPHFSSMETCEWLELDFFLWRKKMINLKDSWLDDTWKLDSSPTTPMLVHSSFQGSKDLRSISLSWDTGTGMF